MKRFDVVVQAEQAGGYWGEVPTLPGCYSQGETVEELFANLREAIAGVLDVMREGGPASTIDPAEASQIVVVPTRVIDHGA